MHPNERKRKTRPTSSQEARDDGLTGEELARLAEVLLEGTGIQLGGDKRLLAETRLRQRARQLGLPSLRQYCDRVWSGQGDAAEQEHLIHAMTTHQTNFFREPHHFDFIAAEILPAIGRRRITVWSAGCSTGEEVWSLAMLLADHQERVGFPDFELLGTDVSISVLRHAAAAVYKEESTREISEQFRRKYLMRSRNRAQQLVKIVPELRGHAKFVRANLVAPRPEITPEADLVFCRNVMIYFDQPTRHRLLDRLVAALPPGGYLFLGHSESLIGKDWPLTPVAPSAFRKH